MTCALPIDGKQKTAYERSEEHTSELQSHDNLECRLLIRSEEHTSELQSHDNLVCRLLLEKKNTKAFWTKPNPPTPTLTHTLSTIATRAAQPQERGQVERYREGDEREEGWNFFF